MANKLSINEFVNTITDFARPNLFQVNFGGIRLSPGGTEHLSAMCKSVQIPGITFIEGKYMLNGFNRKMSIGADFDPITLTFLVDSEGKTIKILREWSNKIFGENGTFGFKEDYQTDISISLLDRAGKVYGDIVLINAYPTNIDPVELSYESSDSILEISVSFNFDETKQK